MMKNMLNLQEIIVFIIHQNKSKEYKQWLVILIMNRWEVGKWAVN